MAFGLLMDDSGQLPGVVLLDRKEDHLQHSSRLSPNDDVGRGDIPLAVLAAPSCDTDFVDVFSALQYRSVGSAEMGGSSACQLFAFAESSARVRFACSMRAGLKKGWGTA